MGAVENSIPDLIGVDEAAEILGVNRRRFERGWGPKPLPGYGGRTGRRWFRSDVYRWLELQREIVTRETVARDLLCWNCRTRCGL